MADQAANFSDTSGIESSAQSTNSRETAQQNLFDDAYDAHKVSIFLQYNFRAMDRDLDGLIEMNELNDMLISSWANLPGFQTVREKHDLLSNLAGKDGDGGISMLDAKTLDRAFNNTSDNEAYDNEHWSLFRKPSIAAQDYYQQKRDYVLSHGLMEEIRRNEANSRTEPRGTYLRREYIEMRGLDKSNSGQL